MLSIKTLLAKALRTDSGWTTIPSSTGTVRYRIIRGFVIIFVEGITDAKTTAWTDICTIPAAIRPPTYWYVKGAIGSYSKNTLSMYINATGVLRVSADTTGTGYGTIMYPLL